MPELKRKAKKVRAAATNAEEKAKRAEENRDLFAGIDEDEGEGWFHGKGRRRPSPSSSLCWSRGCRPSSTRPVGPAAANGAGR